MKTLLIFLNFLLPPVDSGQTEHKIELYVFNETCIPINYLNDQASFSRNWYKIARKYKPKGVPILTKHDILDFDTENFQIKVSEKGWELIKNEGIPTNGIPVMLVIDGKVSYGAWLWTPLSSSTCDGVSLVFMEGNEERALLIQQAPNIPEEWRIPKEL